MCDAPFVKIRCGNTAKVKTMGPNWTGNIAVKFKGSATVESICMCRSTMRKKRRFHRLLLLGGLFFFPFLFFFLSFSAQPFSRTLPSPLIHSPAFPQFNFQNRQKSRFTIPPCPLLSFYPFDKIINRLKRQNLLLEETLRMWIKISSRRYYEKGSENVKEKK